MKAHAIPCPHQPPTRGDNTVSVAQDVSGESLCLSKESSCFPERLSVQIFVIQRVKARVLLCPHQPPARGNNIVSVA